MSSASGELPNDAYSDQKATKGTPMPRWLPVSLLGLTTAALAVPIFLLRRQQASIFTKSLKNVPPPPRRSATATTPIGRMSASASLASGHTYPLAEHSYPRQGVPNESVAAEDDFNGALYCLKAFGYATAMVFAGAIATVWGVKTYMGVEDTQEFAHRMRLAVLKHMPKLSARIHRAAEEIDGLSRTHSDGHGEIDPATWTWPDAERRLKAAFDKDGFSGWAEAAAKELEAEGQIERLKRGHTRN